MSSPPSARPGSVLLALLFVSWCFTVGTLLMYAPWMPAWARWTAGFADPRVQQIVGHPTFRGAISGFGLFHLVWGTHDLDLLIAAFLRRRHRLASTEREEE